MAFEEVLPWRRFSVRLNFSDIPILPQLLARISPAHVARLRRGLGCIWPRMLWLAEGLYPKQIESDPSMAAARPYDAFETTMRTLRRRLSSGKGKSIVEEPWRSDVESCIVMAGDDQEFDLDALRAEVRRDAQPLSADAVAVDGILREWQASRDDKTFAMKTRFFPSVMPSVPMPPCDC